MPGASVAKKNQWSLTGLMYSGSGAFKPKKRPDTFSENQSSLTLLILIPID